VTHDPEADALYLYLTESPAGARAAARTEEVADGVMLDFDDQGRVIGVEVLSVSKRPDAKPMQMAFEVLTAASPNTDVAAE
jgi:uncharacterized protein YuzE